MTSLVRLCHLCEGGMGAPVWPDGGALITLRLRNSTPGANLQPPEEFS